MFKHQTPQDRVGVGGGGGQIHIHYTAHVFQCVMMCIYHSEFIFFNLGIFSLFSSRQFSDVLIPLYNA